MRNRKEQTVTQLEKIEKERSMKVYKADDLLQKARFTLSPTEQRIILYAISKIKPSDVVFQEYTIELNDFYNVCGIHNESYTKTKQIIQGLADKSWWLVVNDPSFQKGKCESLVRWFTTVRTNENSGKIKIMFHPDMLPFLLDLSRQLADGETFYTHYELRYVLPMKSKFSIRLYELLKSYQKNNQEWWFKIDDLKYVLDCDHYTNFKDFRVRVLEKAVKEINIYSDLNIEYTTEKNGKSVDIITFFMVEKDKHERIKARQNGLTVLDGDIHYWDKS